MIRGAGMPSYRHHDPGNMYITFEIEFPNTTPPLGEEQRDTLKYILGLPVPTPQEKAHLAAQRKQEPNGMDLDNVPDLEVDALTPQLPPNVQEDEFDLEDVDAGGHQRAHRATMGDDDEDGVPHGAERMQCASQ